VTEFSISPSGAVLQDGKEVKLGGKPWPGPRDIRNLRVSFSQVRRRGPDFFWEKLRNRR
jgi:hypothetical protein